MMALPILWTASAENDLLAIADYIAARNPAAAHRLARQIRESVLPLAGFPYMYRESEKMRKLLCILPTWCFTASPQPILRWSM